MHKEYVFVFQTDVYAEVIDSKVQYCIVNLKEKEMVHAVFHRKGEKHDS